MTCRARSLIVQVCAGIFYGGSGFKQDVPKRVSVADRSAVGAYRSRLVGAWLQFLRRDHFLEKQQDRKAS
jgi:hypothetical protein